MNTSAPDPQAVLEQLEEIKRQYLEAQSDVAAVRATGFDQDRKVSVTVLGFGEVSDIKIDPAAVDPSDVDGLQQKILQAFRSANNQARDLAAQILSPLNIGLPSPGPASGPDAPVAAPGHEAVPSLSPGVSLSLDFPADGPKHAIEEAPEQPPRPSLANYQHYRPRW